MRSCGEVKGTRAASKAPGSNSVGASQGGLSVPGKVGRGYLAEAVVGQAPWDARQHPGYGCYAGC